MDEELYPFVVFFLIFIGWLFYLNTGGKNQKFYKKGETFKDEFGDYFVQDIEKLVTYVEALPKENQINIYMNILHPNLVIMKMKHLNLTHQEKSKNYMKKMLLMQQKQEERMQTLI
jgi:hypothetical protein